MRKQKFTICLLLVLVTLVIPLVVSAQSRGVLTRTVLSRMNVFSRAELFEKEIADAARKEGVDPRILWTIAYNETRFRPWLTSPKNAQGLMQFIPGTAARFGLADPYEPNASIHAAARYVYYLGRLFGSRVESILAAYNSGEGTVLAYLHGRSLSANGKQINPNAKRMPGGIPPYRETVNYVTNGMRVYRWLRAQGKFDSIRKDSRRENTETIPAQESDLVNQTKSSETVAATVLYDPRSGNRYFVNGGSKLRPIEQSGAVIVSHEGRVPSAKKARSTFAGTTPGER